MTERFKLRVNGGEHEVAAEPKTPLLYILRNDLKLKGTRFGCGTGHCGACTVLMERIGDPTARARGRSVAPMWSWCSASV